MRRGTSLVEVLVFGFIGMAVIALVMGIMMRTTRQTVLTQERLRALQALGLLSERIAHDLTGGVAFRRPDGKDMRATASADGRTLELYHFHPDPKQAADPVGSDGGVTPIRVERIAYTFDPAKGTLMRQYGGTPPAAAVLNRFLSVRFSIPPPGGARLLTLKVDWVPEERLSRPPEDRGEAVRLECMMGLEGEAAFDQHPFRVLNPTSKLSL